MVDVPESVCATFPHFDLSVLSAAELDVVVLRCEGVSWRKLADLVGCPRMTAYHRWERALSKLRDVLPQSERKPAREPHGHD